MISIVSYPDRGRGGRSSYRGNCSPKLIEDLIKQFHVREISDYMAGSGTSEDVAKNLGIESHCYDLNRGFDLIDNEIKERSEFIFWHPPYWDIVKYAGGQYSAEEIIRKYGFDPAVHDLSRKQKWEEFIKELNYCMIKQFSSLEKGGRMAVLVGDIKKRGKLYSMILELAKPGTIENIVIKAEHNCLSNGKYYANRNFIPIMHEYVLIVRKDNPLLFDIQYAGTVHADVRDLKIPTWKDVVAAVLEHYGRPMTLNELYRVIDGHKKTKSNPHWKDKIRQTLQINNIFSSKQRGVWALKQAA